MGVEGEGSGEGTSWSGQNWRAGGWSTKNADWGLVPVQMLAFPPTGWALCYQLTFLSWLLGL